LAGFLSCLDFYKTKQMNESFCDHFAIDNKETMPELVPGPVPEAAVAAVPPLVASPTEPAAAGDSVVPVVQSINVAEMSVPSNMVRHKCKVKGCPMFTEQQWPMEMCSVDDCINMVHYICYQNVVCKTSGKKSRTPFENVSFCTCAHHDQYAKNVSDVNLTWTNDGANGRDDPYTSQHYLIQWLTTGDNYNKFRSPSGGRTKIDLAAEVAAFINSKGVKVERTRETVNAKITWMQGCMRETYDWTVTPTGEGIRENEGFDSLMDKVRI
jgi:hypothetical protein